ncbi:GIY-YIG nuclease family protein [Paenibacillus tianjinensis]|uniref:GIY-YIG nuclease family protein n=2 Tax=Paenibacillus tianjinensis TaxID=2810347 RepID=A0ABX7LIH7_9BACL|nr:GIY-YIG nuclease family protein [Paenibacillus tianjinensis]
MQDECKNHKFRDTLFRQLSNCFFKSLCKVENRHLLREQKEKENIEEFRKELENIRRKSEYNNGIYKILNRINQKCYIGKSTYIESRWQIHKYQLRANKHHCKELQKEWNTFGEESFLFERVVEVPKSESLEEKEYEVWSYYKSKELLLNLHPPMSEFSALKLEAERLKTELKKYKLLEMNNV